MNTYEFLRLWYVCFGLEELYLDYVTESKASVQLVS